MQETSELVANSLRADRNKLEHQWGIHLLTDNVMSSISQGSGSRLQAVVEFMIRLMAHNAFSDKLRMRVLKQMEADPTEGRLRSLWYLLSCGRSALELTMPEVWKSVVKTAQNIYNNKALQKGARASIIQVGD